MSVVGTGGSRLPIVFALPFIIMSLFSYTIPLDVKGYDLSSPAVGIRARRVHISLHPLFRCSFLPFLLRSLVLLFFHFAFFLFVFFVLGDCVRNLAMTSAYC